MVLKSNLPGTTERESEYAVAYGAVERSAELGAYLLAGLEQLVRAQSNAGSCVASGTSSTSRRRWW